MPESTYTPMNGLELKDLLKKRTVEAIDKIPYLRAGNAFHKAKIIWAMTMTAHPADCPVPEAEYNICVAKPEVTSGEIAEALKHEDKVTKLEAKREALVKSIEQIDKVLEIIRPKDESQEELNAGNTPDELRVANGMPIPMIVKTNSGARVERFVDPKTLHR